MDDLGYPSTAEHVRGALEDAQSDAGDVLVAEDGDGRIVGFAAYQLVYFIEDGAPRCRLTALVVDPGYRRSGVGRRLVDSVRRVAEESQCTAVEATSNRSDDRQAAHRFYREVGFMDGATEKIFFTMPLRTQEPT